MDTWIIVVISVAASLLVCGGVGAYCSNEKGRSGIEGFLFGVLLGPFGVIAAASLPDHERSSSVDAPGRSIDLTAPRDDVSNPEELERWLKRTR
jgi:hypothetical protein